MVHSLSIMWALVPAEIKLKSIDRRRLRATSESDVDSCTTALDSRG